MDNNEFSAPKAPVAPAKQSNSKVIIAAVVALLLGGGIATAVCLLANQGSKSESENASNCTTQEAPIAIEPIKDESGNEIANRGTILDARLSAELAYKTNRVLANTATSERTVYMDTTGKTDDYKNLSNFMRMSIVIDDAWSNRHIDTAIPAKDLPDSYASKQYFLQNNIESANAIKIDDAIKSDYRDLFGEDITEYVGTVTSDFSTNSCGADYIQELSAYISHTGCGGAAPYVHSMYQYKNELDGNKAYVYVAIVGRETGRDGGSDDKIYSGFISENNALSIAKNDYYIVDAATGMGRRSDMTYEFRGKPFWQQVAHYRAVFEKDNTGNFVYKTIESVND